MHISLPLTPVQKYPFRTSMNHEGTIFNDFQLEYQCALDLYLISPASISTMSYSTFPSSYSIPPSAFFTLEGLPGWLNQNPTYKQYFVNSPKYFPYLLTTSTVSEYVSSANVAPEYGIYSGYKIENVPIAPFITMSEQNDARLFREHLRLFRQVYEHNSNAWVNYTNGGADPVYYRFPNSSERTQYLTARGTLFKLYPLDAISSAKNEAGSSLGWVIPFPL